MSIPLAELSQVQRDGIAAHAASIGIDTDRLSVAVERDEPHDEHLFVFVYDDGTFRGEIIVDGDGQVDAGQEA